MQFASRLTILKTVLFAMILGELRLTTISPRYLAHTSSRDSWRHACALIIRLWMPGRGGNFFSRGRRAPEPLCTLVITMTLIATDSIHSAVSLNRVSVAMAGRALSKRRICFAGVFKRQEGSLNSN